MQSFKRQSNIKLGLFAFALIIASSVFLVNRIIVGQIREDAKKQVEHLAKAYTEAINTADENDIHFVMDMILPSLNFPLVITFSDEIYAIMNLDIAYPENSKEYKQEIQIIIQRMDESFPPLGLTWNDKEIGYIHYGDSAIVNKMEWLPFLEVGLAILFLILVLWGIQLIRNSEKNSIFAGMARETAHQLGTPISSLMGWVNFLEDEGHSRKEIAQSMNEDISRLSEISDRFSKIGSNPQLKDIDLNATLTELTTYLQHRLPKRSEIDLKFSADVSHKIAGDKILLTWSFENIIRYAIDAIEAGKGSVQVKLYENESKIRIDFIDSGRGINRKNWKNIFKPGFSTKKRGWGLGLSLTHRIISEIHSGRIKVVNSKKGETIIRVKF